MIEVFSNLSLHIDGCHCQHCSQKGAYHWCQSMFSLTKSLSRVLGNNFIIFRGTSYSFRFKVDSSVLPHFTLHLLVAKLDCSILSECKKNWTIFILIDFGHVCAVMYPRHIKVICGFVRNWCLEQKFSREKFWFVLIRCLRFCCVLLIWGPGPSFLGGFELLFSGLLPSAQALVWVLFVLFAIPVFSFQFFPCIVSLDCGLLLPLFFSGFPLAASTCCRLSYSGRLSQGAVAS